MLKGLIIAALIALLVSTTSHAATPVPAIGLDDLIRQADIVVVGRLADISEIGSTIVEGVTARSLSATIYADEVIKGGPQDVELRINYAEPHEPIGYRSIAADSYGMFFLRRSTVRIELASPYYPYLAALPGFRTSAASATDRVYEVVANVIRVDSNVSNKLEAISLLRQSANPIARGALRSTIGSGDQELALRAAAALLQVGDPTALKRIETALRSNRAGLSDETYVTVLGALEGLKEPSALATLERLLADGDVGTRRAAIRSLRLSYSKGAVRSLVRALDDNDFEVRHNAVMALSEAFDEAKWGPSVDAFAEDERRFITFWKEWDKQRK